MGSREIAYCGWMCHWLSVEPPNKNSLLTDAKVHVYMNSESYLRHWGTCMQALWIRAQIPAFM